MGTVYEGDAIRSSSYASRRRRTTTCVVAAVLTVLVGLVVGIGTSRAVSAHRSAPLPAPVGAESPAPEAHPVVAPAPPRPAPPQPVAPPRTVIPAGETLDVVDDDSCSTGFAVTGPAGQDGFLSAGHCGQRGQAVQTGQGDALGSFAASDFPGTDYGWVAVAPAYTAGPVVSRHDGTVAVVRGGSAAGVGAPVCLSGRASGWHCGTITALNQTVSYDQGLVYGLTATSVCSDAGDSGGVFLSADQAQGIVSGGVGDCSSDGTTYFQPLAPALAAYGLTLRTD